MRHIVRLAALVFALALVCGLTRAGSRFFYCASMGVMSGHPCCDHPDDSEEPALSAPEPACCEAGKVPSTPPAAGSIEVPVFAAPVVAVIEPPPLVSPPPVTTVVLERQDRGPPLLTRSQLMVLHI
jgi:hypothetical protein